MAKDMIISMAADKADLRKMSRDIEKVGSLQGIDSKTLRKRWQQPLGRIRGDLGEFEKSMAASNARVIAFGASTALIAGVATALKGAAKAAIDVERSLADINVILNATSKNLNKFGQELFSIAKNTGQSFKVVAEAAGELARQGLGMEDTLRRTSDALILARLSGMDTVEAVNSLTAAVNSFAKSALTSTEIVNKLANVDAAFAVSSADLAEAIKRVGSSASDAGVSMDELIAIVTTAQQTTARGGAVIGNSFKTIFTRLQRPAVLDQLEALGIATKDASGNIMPLMGVLKGLAITFDKLEDVQKSQIAELVGGVFQVNVLKAALSDLGQEYSVYGRALDTSISSTNEAIERNQKLNETLSALINRTFVNLQNVGAQVGDIGFAPKAKDILGTINKGLEAGSDLKSGEEIGDKLGRGVIKGLGNFFLGGPGLLLGALGIGQLMNNLRKFAFDAFKGITGLNSGTKKRAAMEEQITGLLMQDDKLINQIANGTLDAASAADKVLQKYQAQERILTKIRGLSSGASGKLPPGVFSGGGGKASGFIPNFSGKAEERLAMLAAGYSPSDVKNASIRKTRIYDGSGGSFSSFVNNRETVRTGTNAQGYKSTFVVPPKSSSAFGNYVKKVPNFAQRVFGPDDFTGSSAGDFDSFLKDFEEGRYRRNRAGVSVKKSRKAFSAFQSLTPRKKNLLASRGPKPYTGETQSLAGVFKKYGIKSPLNVSALAFPDVGKKAGGAINMVGSPFDALKFQSSFGQAYPRFLQTVGGKSLKKSSVKGRPELDTKLRVSLQRRLKSVASDPNASAQVRGRVFEVLSAAILKNWKATNLGMNRVDLARGGGVQNRYMQGGVVSPEYNRALAESGIELKAGGFRMFGKGKGILRKLVPSNKANEFEADLRAAQIIKGDPYRQSIFGGAASGFIPNFSGKNRAMSTERAMGGDPEYRRFPFPHVADRKRQKDFKGVLRDHPEGIGEAMKNSFAAQGVPNFASPKGNFFDEMKAKMFGGMSKGASDKLSKNYQKLSDEIEGLDQTLRKNVKALEKHKAEIEKANKGEASTLVGSKTPLTKDKTWKKSSRDYKEAMKKEASLAALTDPEAVRRSKDLPRAKQKVIQKQTEEAAGKSAKGDKMRSKAFTAAFLLPTIAGPLTEMLPIAESTRKGLDQITTGLSTAATALTMIPGPAGVAAAMLVGIGSTLGSITNMLAIVGENIGENQETLKESLQNMQDASSRFFDVSSKLDSAIKAGASGDTLTRLGNKLEETLSLLDPAQQALLTSSLSLAEKQNEMAKIIDQKAKQLKQVESAAALAASINDARGMGIASFFKGIGGREGMLRGGSFRAGANDVDAITSKNVRAFGQGIFTTVGSKKMREIDAKGGLRKGSFVSSLENAGVDKDLIAMLNELNNEGLESLRQGLVATTKEAERNAKVAKQNIVVQKMYNQLIAEATKLTQEASDHLLDLQKRLVESFVFHREMKSDKLFNQIDVHIAKFDALFGAAAQNLNAFEKADIIFRKKRLNSEIKFQKQITTNQNTFIQSASQIAAVSTGVVQEKTDKKTALRRSQQMVDQSRTFTHILEKYDKSQDIEQFNASIKDLLVTQGGSTQKAQDKLETAFTKFHQDNAKQLEEQAKAVEIAQEIREIEKQQAELLRGGGIKAIIDPNSFVDLRNKMVDAMEDIFLGSGGARGALGENDLQAGSGFLNLLQSLRKQGFDTGAFADNNPGLKRRAIGARQGQNLAIAEDLRFLANTMGDPALAMLAKQVADPATARKQVEDYLDPGKQARRQQDLQRKLLSDQGKTFETGINKIETILQTNVDEQSVTFARLDLAAQELDEAAASLYRIEILRQFDTTAAKLRQEASTQKVKDAAQSGAAAAKSVAAEFGDQAGTLVGLSGGSQSVFKGPGGVGVSNLDAILMAFGKSNKGKWLQASDEEKYATIMSDIIGDRRFTESLGAVMSTRGKTFSELSSEPTTMGFVTSLVKELQGKGMAGGLSDPETGQLIKSMHKQLFDFESDSGYYGNIAQTLQKMSRKGNPDAKNLTDAIIDGKQAADGLKFATADLGNKMKDGQKALEDRNDQDRREGLVTNDNIARIVDTVARKRVRSGDVSSRKDAFDVEINNFMDGISKATAPFVRAMKDPMQVNFGEHIIKINAGQALQQGIVNQIAATTAETFVKALEAMGITTDIEMLKKQMEFLRDAANTPLKTKTQIDAAKLPLIRSNNSGRVMPTMRKN